MNINISIHDFAPIFRRPEYIFRGLQQTGVDGVELVIGFKSRWNVAHYQKMAHKYDIPIASLHQPLWASMGLWFDEKSFALANQLGIRRITCHPLPKLSLDHPRMQTYLQHLAAIQDRTGISILLENMPEQYDNRLLRRLFPLEDQTNTMIAVYRKAMDYGLGITLDIDHLQLAEPHKAAWFAEVLPSVQNIHLSSFSKGKRHLPLYAGGLRVVPFVQHLKKVGYQGLLTLEINYPKAIMWHDYDFDAIKKSVAIVKDI